MTVEELAPELSLRTHDEASWSLREAAREDGPLALVAFRGVW